MTSLAPTAPLHASDRQRCDALRSERSGLIIQLARHKPRTHRYAVLTVRIQDVTARLLEIENRLSANSATFDALWKDDDADHFPDQKSRAAGR